MNLIELWGRGINRIINFCVHGLQEVLIILYQIDQISDNFLEICFPLEEGYVNASEQVTEQVKRLLKSLDDYLQPAMDMEFIEMTQPDSPKRPTQKYRLTAKGIEIKKQL